MGDVLQFKRPEKKHWRDIQGKPYKPLTEYVKLPSGASISSDRPGAFGEMPQEAKELLGLIAPTGETPKLFQSINQSLGNSSLYGAYLELLVSNGAPARSKMVSSTTDWFMPRDPDEPCVTLIMKYDTGYTARYDFMGRDDVEAKHPARIGKVPIIDVAPQIWVKVHPFLILTLHDVLAKVNESSPITILQDKTDLRFSIVFNAYSRTRINVTLSKTDR